MDKTRRVIWRATWLAIATLCISACNVSLETEIPILPNLQGELPESSHFEYKTNSNSGPTEQSKQESRQGTKNAILNLVVASSIEQETGLDKQQNCIQLVQFSSGTVLVDFSNRPCPYQASTTAHPDSIRLSATYQKIIDNDYELYHQKAAIGVMRIDFDTPRIDLLALCTGSHAANCFLSTTSKGQIDTIYPF